MPRSRLLEDFCGNRLSNLKLVQVQTHVAEFAKDQHGSRFLQQQLDLASPDEVEMIFNELLFAFSELSTDVFANYVVQ